MKPPLRIAVLECDTPIGPIYEKYGGYGDIFETLLCTAADALQNPELSSKSGLEVTKFNVHRDQALPELEVIDAVLISGSRFNSFDNDPWILKLVEFTKKVLAQNRVRIIGVCFGHQIVGRALGVKVDKSDAGWEIAVVPMELTAKGKEVFGKDVVNIHQMHRDIVYSYPQNVEPLGHSPRCAVQGMYEKGRLISVQGHPEFSEFIVRELVETRHTQGIFTDEVYQDAIARVAKEHDGVVVAMAFLRFLLDD